MNIIPDSAEVVFDLRAQTNTLTAELKTRVAGAATAAASLHADRQVP